MRLKLKTLIAVLALALTGPVRANESGMDPVPVFSAIMNGDYATVGTSTRVRNGAVVADPVVLNLAGVPAGGVVVKAYLSWSYMGDIVLVNDVVLLNGNAVNGALVGVGDPDLAWGYLNGMSYIADVTALVPGNGIYQVAGAIDNPGLQRIGEGVSLVVVYGDPAAPVRAIHVYKGYTGTTSGTGESTMAFVVPYAGGVAHFFVNGIDGQKIFTDEFLVNNLFASNKFGLLGAGNAWQGSLGPGAVDFNYYDHAEGDAAAFMVIGDIQITSKTQGFLNSATFTDAIGHSIGAMAFPLAGYYGMDSYTIMLGKVQSGNLNSLKADDNDPLVACKFFIPFQGSPFIRLQLQGTCPVANPSVLGFRVKSKMVHGGLFQQTLYFFNWNQNQYTDSRSDTTNLSYATRILSASNPVSRFVNGSRQTRGRLEVLQVGPSTNAFPCQSIEFADFLFQP